jgi:hypothetical protein
MPQRRPSRLARWFDGILAERQVYVRGGATAPHFVTDSRRARTIRFVTTLTLAFTVLALGGALVLGYQRYDALWRELASLRGGAGGSPSATSTAATTGAAPPALLADELARLRREVEAERSRRVQLEAEAAQERDATGVARRSRDAELEALRVRADLLSGQLAAAEQQQQRLASELAASRPAPAAGPEGAADAPRLQTELAAARQRIAALERTLNSGTPLASDG